MWAVGPLLAVLSGCAAAERPSPSPIFLAADDGYLDPAALQSLAAATPGPPAPGSPQDRADRNASARLAGFEDTDRWLMATAHAELRPPLALQHFDCALGVRRGAVETPTLDRMAAKAFHDAQAAAILERSAVDRPAPAADPQRRACQTLGPGGAPRSDSPSAAAVVGTVYAETLARIAPERAEAARRIGHEIGVSRLICALAYPADVAAGEALGRAVADEIVATPAFQAEMTAARAEIAAARATGRTNPGCAAERAALATPLP
ncbi:PA-phosphatase [Pseudomonas sp. ODNR1LW]|nr:PA-phosphatase [Pseudomonas sp. ODNR1LW]